MERRVLYGYNEGIEIRIIYFYKKKFDFNFIVFYIAQNVDI